MSEIGDDHSSLSLEIILSSCLSSSLSMDLFPPDSDSLQGRELISLTLSLLFSSLFS